MMPYTSSRGNSPRNQVRQTDYIQTTCKLMHVCVHTTAADMPRYNQCLAALRTIEGDFASSEKHYKRSLAVNPSDVMLRNDFSLQVRMYACMQWAYLDCLPTNLHTYLPASLELLPVLPISLCDKQL